MIEGVNLVYGNNSDTDKIVTFVLPIIEWYSMFQDCLNSILNQNAKFNYDIVVLYDSSDLERNQKIMDTIEEINNNKILVYECNSVVKKNELYNTGFILAKGKWISLIEDNFIFLDNRIKKIGKLLSFIESYKLKVSYISIWFINLRIVYKNYNQLQNEVNHMLSRSSEDIDKYNLVELNDKNFWNYGGFGINVPNRGSLYLKEAYLKTNGFNEKYYPLENVFLVKEMENHGEYKTFLSIIPYGAYVTLDAIFKNKEDMIKSFNLWMTYVDKKVDLLLAPSYIKKRKKRYLHYKQKIFFINRHRSFNMTLKDFEFDNQGRFNRRLFIISYIIANWKYKKWVEKQYKVNDKRMKGLDEYETLYYAK